MEIKNSSQFLYVAKGSCGEVRVSTLRGVDQGYIAAKESEELAKSFKRLSSHDRHLIDYLKRSGMKGPKYTRFKPSIMSRLLNDSQLERFEP